MDIVSGAVGVAGALGGVGLGAWITGRNERLMLRESHRREDRQARVNACVAFLAVYRQFRVFVLTEDPEVTLAPERDSGREVPLVKGGQKYAEAISEAIGRLLLLEGDPSPIVHAANGVAHAFLGLATCRSRIPSGPLPDEVVARSREAEKEFVRAARRELERSV